MPTLKNAVLQFLRQGIEDRSLLGDGGRLPSIRRVIARMPVPVSSRPVFMALRELEREGLIRPVRGKGYFLTAPPALPGARKTILLLMRHDYNRPRRRLDPIVQQQLDAVFHVNRALPAQVIFHDIGILEDDSAAFWSSVDGVVGEAYMPLNHPRLAGVPKAAILVLPDFEAVLPADVAIGYHRCHATALGVRHLAAGGCRRVALLTSPRLADYRVPGWRAALREASLAEGPLIIAHSTNPKYMLADPDDARIAEDALAGHLDRQPAGELGFDGLMASTAFLAEGAVRALDARGFGLGRDYRLCAHDYFPEVLKSFGMCCAVKLDMTALLTAAVEGLLAVMNGRPRFRELWLPPEVVCAGTCQLRSGQAATPMPGRTKKSRSGKS